MPISKRPQNANKSAKLTPLQMRRKIALLKAGLTVADVAREAGVTRQYAWQVIYGEKDAGPAEKVRLAWAALTGRGDLLPMPGPMDQAA